MKSATVTASISTRHRVHSGELALDLTMYCIILEIFTVVCVIVVAVVACCCCCVDPCVLVLMTLSG